MRAAVRRILEVATAEYGFLTIKGIKAIAFEPGIGTLDVLIRMNQGREVMKVCEAPAFCAEIEAEFETTGNYVRDIAFTWAAVETVNKLTRQARRAEFEKKNPVRVECAGETMAYGISPEEAGAP